MSPIFQRLLIYRCLSWCEYRYRICGRRKFCANQLSTKEKLTIELLPELEKRLESEDIKHRQHPGIRKLVPVSVPEVLKAAVDNIIGGQYEKSLHIEAKKLCNRLKWRRQPIEKDEVDKKIQERIPEFPGYEYEMIPEMLTKKHMKELKKSINLEAGKWKPIEYDHLTSLAYLVGRLAPNYASVSHVFDVLKMNEPTFKPETYFDFGSGVGSSLWAAHSKWSDTIKEYFCTDISGDMNDLCQTLITDATTGQKHIEPVFFRQFLPASDDVKFDLVVSAFSLLELPGQYDRLKAIDTLWRKTKEFLIVIEYGNIAGFSSVIDARDYILKVENDSSPEFDFYSSGAHVISPCPHDLPCPKFQEKPSSPCGFNVLYHPQFPRGHQEVILKDWISYVIIKKGKRPEDTSPLPRIVKPVLKRTRHVICRLCCNDGKLKEVIVSRAKQGKHAYRCARKSKEGDIFPGNVKILEELPDAS